MQPRQKLLGRQHYSSLEPTDSHVTNVVASRNRSQGLAPGNPSLGFRLPDARPSQLLSFLSLVLGTGGGSSLSHPLPVRLRFSLGHFDCSPRGWG